MTDWIAYYSLEPFGQPRTDINFAIVAKTVADVNRPKGKEPYPIDNFVPKFKDILHGVDSSEEEVADGRNEKLRKQVDAVQQWKALFNVRFRRDEANDNKSGKSPR